MLEILIDIAIGVVVGIICFILGRSWGKVEKKIKEIKDKFKRYNDTKEVRKMLKDNKKEGKIQLKSAVNNYLSTEEFNYFLYKELINKKNLYGKNKKALIQMQKNNHIDIEINITRELEQEKYMKETCEKIFRSGIYLKDMQLNDNYIDNIMSKS